MSFRDPYRPFGPEIGPDIVEPQTARPDVKFSPATLRSAGWNAPVRSFLKGAVVLAGATCIASFLLFVPVLYGELSSVEAVSMKGEVLSASEFASRLTGMLFGNFIVALSLVCFLASAALASRQQGVSVATKKSKADNSDVTDPILSALVKVRHV